MKRGVSASGDGEQVDCLRLGGDGVCPGLRLWTLGSLRARAAGGCWACAATPGGHQEGTETWAREHEGSLAVGTHMRSLVQFLKGESLLPAQEQHWPMPALRGDATPTPTSLLT